MKRTLILTAITAGILFLFFPGCGNITLYSKWKNHDIVIDGLDTEWRGSRFLIDKEYITVGVMNDNENIYIRISTPDRTKQLKLVHSGMTLWFDPDVKDKKKNGILYPVKSARRPFPRDNSFPPNGESRQDENYRRDRGSSPVNDNGSLPAEPMEGMENSDNFSRITIPPIPDSLAIVGPTEESVILQSFAEAKDKGIEVRIGASERDVIYEMKAPLAFVMGDKKGASPSSEQTIAVGIEINKPDKDALPGSGRRRGDDRRQNINFSGPGARIDPMAESYEIWLKVVLASPH